MEIQIYRFIKMPKFEYDDIVKIISSAPEEFRPGLIAWIVGVHEERRGEFLKEFPLGIVYTVEFEDGSSIEIHENLLSRPEEESP